MTRSLLVPPGRRGQVRVAQYAAQALTAEWARHPGPKTGLIIGADAGSAVLGAALAQFKPQDRLTVVAGPAGIDDLRASLVMLGDEVDDRIRLVESLADAPSADVAIFAEPLTGTEGQTRDLLAEASGRLNPGGVLSVATPAPTPLADGATDEADRQSAFYGVGTDLVLRNRPPLRVHRMRFTPADTALAERLAPARRPSSVRLTRALHIDSSGVAAAGALAGLAAFARVTRPRSRVWLLPALAAVPVAVFFRDPERAVPTDADAIVAASDGVVVSVEPVRDTRFGADGDWLRIAVFLSLADTHINRSPVAGRVADHFVESGGHARADSADAEHNVAGYTVLETPRGRVVVAQRTGLLARRLVQRAPAGSVLARGERFGLIRFGSRTDVYLPAGAVRPQVEPRDRVTGGSTVIARWV